MNRDFSSLICTFADHVEHNRLEQFARGNFRLPIGTMKCQIDDSWQKSIFDRRENNVRSRKMKLFSFCYRVRSLVEFRPSELGKSDDFQCPKRRLLSKDCSKFYQWENDSFGCPNSRDIWRFDTERDEFPFLRITEQSKAEFRFKTVCFLRVLFVWFFSRFLSARKILFAYSNEPNLVTRKLLNER